MDWQLRACPHNQLNPEPALLGRRMGHSMAGDNAEYSCVVLLTRQDIPLGWIRSY
jgi:hypothetical protein